MTTFLATKNLRKHTAAVHIGATGFTLMHKKCINAALYLARDTVQSIHGGNFDSYLEKTAGREVNHKVSLTDFKSLINYNSNDNMHLREVLSKLTSTSVEFNVLGDSINDEAWASMALLSYVSIVGSTVTFRFPSEIRNQLLNPKVYAQISLAIQNLFGSDYSLSLYENTIRYKRIGQTPWIKLYDFRKLMGIPDNSYTEYKYLNKDVIKKAIKEINKVSDTELSLETKKIGRYVDMVKFHITRKVERDLFINDTESDKIEQSDLERYLFDFGLNVKQVTKIIQDYDIAYLMDKIGLIKHNIKKNGGIQNLAAFAYSAIIDNYEDSRLTKTKFVPSNSSISSTMIDDNSRDLIAKYGNSSELQVHHKNTAT